jgi:hypothetical protein
LSKVIRVAPPPNGADVHGAALALASDMASKSAHSRHATSRRAYVYWRFSNRRGGRVVECGGVQDPTSSAPRSKSGLRCATELPEDLN